MFKGRSGGRRIRFSIRVTVVGMFLVATTITAAVAIGLQYFFSRNLATESTLTVYQHAAASTSEHLDKVDAAATQAASLLAEYPGLTDGGWVAAHTRRIFADTLSRTPLFYGIYIGFDNGDFFELVNLDTSVAVRNQLRAQPQDRWVVIEVRGEGERRRRWFHYHDADFNLRASREEATDYLANERPWFTAARTGEVFRTAPYQFRHLQAPGQTYSTRIAGGAVLAVDIALSSISHYLYQQIIHVDSEIFLYQGSGELIASSLPEQGMADIPQSAPLELSAEQRALIAGHPLLTVANELDWPPIDFAVSGRPYGYAIDTLALIAEMTGLRFDYVNGYPWPDLVALFDAGQLDVLQPVFGTPENAGRGALSQSLLDVPYGVVTRPDSEVITDLRQLAGKVVAIPRGWSIVGIIATQFPDITVLEVASVRGMLEAVRAGRADAGLDAAAVLRYTMRQFFIDDVRLHQPLVFSDGELPGHLHFLLGRDNAALVEIFDLALANISDAQKLALQAKWLGEPPKSMGTVPYPQLVTLAADSAGQERLARISIAGRDHFAYVQAVGGEGREPDYFAVVTPVAAVLAPAAARVTAALWITALCLLLLLPVSFWLGGFIVRPVRRLADENRKIGRRDYDALVPVNSRIVEIDELASSLTTMAHAIERHGEQQERLMESFFRLIAEAIDDKSPYTAKHCARVPELAIMLAERAQDASTPPFDEFHFDTEQQWREFRIGAWLHDCGKITTPEHIIDKGTKLELNYNRIHEIRTRFEVLWRDAEVDYWRGRLAEPGRAAALEAELQRRHRQLRDDFAFIAACNLGSESLDQAVIARLHSLAGIVWQRHFDDRLGLSRVEAARFSGAPPALPVAETLLADRPEHLIPRAGEREYPPHLGIRMEVPEHLYNQGELYNLCIPRGTLTPEDRFKINEHIISTIKMLDSLHFPEELAQVPRYASTHHEALDGSGYPRKLTAEELSMPERFIVLADIFEALTAADRPYKPAKTVSTAIEVLYSMVVKGHVDRDVFELFLTSGVYREFASRFLPEEQIDEVNIERYLRPAHG
ncbi:MAG: HD domain-containing phosphohydrolase [Porticoccaceae bacterium]